MSIVELLTVLRNSPTEKFAVFYHTTQGVFGRIMAEGDERGVKFDWGQVVDEARRVRAAKVSIAHNHPSGDVRPSQKDLEATFALQDVFKEFGLSLHDHVIVGPGGKPFSMRNKGVI